MKLKDNNDIYFEIRPRNSFSLNLKELIEYKELFYFFTWRDIKVKYRQTMLGFFWAILQPILLMLIFTFFIGKSLHAPSDKMDYHVFVFSGLILWLVFSSGITNAGNSMITNAQIIKKIYFPRLIIPISAILVAVFDFFMGFLVFIPLLVVFHVAINIKEAILCWPLGLILSVISSFGPGCLLAALNIKYRDFRYVIPFVVQALLFVTPVIYPISVVEQEWLRYLIAINPMYAAIAVFRMPLSDAASDPVLLSISIASGIIFLTMGIVYFRKTEMYFADLV